MGKSLQVSKPRKSIKTTQGDINKLTKDVAELRTFYGDFIASWPLLTPQQREDTLAHSPILASLKALTDPLRG